MQQAQDHQDPNQLAQHVSRLSVNGEIGSFPQQSFHGNKPSMGSLRDRQGAQMPSINTNRMNQNGQSAQDMQTPGTGYDMNFTPLLPQNMLMGSPFNPSSPPTFQSPQFQNMTLDKGD